MKFLALLVVLLFAFQFGHSQDSIAAKKIDSSRAHTKWRFVKRNIKVLDNREWYLVDKNSNKNYIGRIQTEKRGTEYTFLNDELVFMRVYTKTFEQLTPINDYYFSKGQMIFSKGENISIFQKELNEASAFREKLKETIAKR